METPSQTVLVTGASGKTGRRVVKRLQAEGTAVREGSRNAALPFDWHDPATWSPALAGSSAVYLSFFPDLAVPEAPGIIEAFVGHAIAAGVQRIVLLSGRGEHNAQRCEEIVLQCGVDATVVRASWFMQNFDEGHFLDAVRQGVIAMPAGAVKEPFVDVDDIADVAFAALTGDGHAGKVYEVTGPRLMSFDEVAEELAATVGRGVRYQPVTFEQFHAGLASEAGVELADMLTALCREVLDGRNEHVADGVQQALGRAPRDFRDYARAAAATGVWSAVPR